MLGFRSPAFRLIPLALAGAVLAGCASTNPCNRPPKVVMLPSPATQAAPPVASAPKPAPVVRKSAPFRYVVKPGDTLWGISTRFLRSPWLWPEIWYENPYIENAHLIYPGDVITLTTGGNGEPVLSISRGGTLVATTSAQMRTRFLKPKVQRTPLAKAIPTIPYDEIASLLSKPRVMTEEQYHNAPYVLQPTDARLLAAAPNSIYARGIPADQDQSGTQFAVVEKKRALVEPRNFCTLGYEVTYLGRGAITAPGDPTTLQLQASTQEIRAGDRLLPVETGIVPSEFPLLTPRVVVDADIIDVIGGMEEVGQYQVVVLDRGSLSGLRMGDVLAVARPGGRIDDPYAHGALSRTVQLPNRHSGELVVFRVFPEVSFGLVLHALRPIRTGDLVTNP